MLTRPIPGLGRFVHRPRALAASAPMLLASLLAVWATAWLVWETAVHAVAFDGDFSDGPFQLFNVLRRIADGQVWGRDFQAFTGIGTNWAHLPVFFLAGGDLRASEISRFLTSGLCHALAAVALARAFAPAFQSRAHALLFGLLFFAAGATVYGRIFQPGASLLGVRTFFPLLLAAALTARRPAPRIALALAASLFSSVDHALASLITLAVAVSAAFAGKATKDRRAPLLLGTAAGLALFAAILFAATSGHVVAPLRYALFDIPADQFWYFGAPPVEFLPVNVRALLEHPTYIQFGLTWLLAAGAAVVLWRRYPTLAPLVVFMFVYATLGTVSQLGYISPLNLHGSERLLFALILAALLATGTPRLVMLGTTAVALCIAAASAKRLQPSPLPPQDGYLSAEWRRHLAAVDRHAGTGSIWSVYASLPEVQRDFFHPDTDYLIHALGPERRARYIARFLQTKPSLVRLDPPRWPFAVWFQLHNWPFYREVFRAYEPVYTDDLGSLWRPAGTPVTRPDSIDVSLDQRGCGRLPAPPMDTIYSVSVSYAVQNPSASSARARRNTAPAA